MQALVLSGPSCTVGLSSGRTPRLSDTRCSSDFRYDQIHGPRCLWSIRPWLLASRRLQTNPRSILVILWPIWPLLFRVVWRRPTPWSLWPPLVVSLWPILSTPHPSIQLTAVLTTLLTPAAYQCSASTAPSAPQLSVCAEPTTLLSPPLGSLRLRPTPWPMWPVLLLAFDLYDPSCITAFSFGRPHYHCSPDWE